MKYSTVLKKYNINEKKLIKEYLKGVNYEQLKKDFKCSRRSIDIIISKNNIPLREKAWSKKPEDGGMGKHGAIVLKKLSEGVSQAQIAKHIGVRRQRVYQIIRNLKKNNLIEEQTK